MGVLNPCTYCKGLYGIVKAYLRTWYVRMSTVARLRTGVKLLQKALREPVARLVGKAMARLRLEQCLCGFGDLRRATPRRGGPFAGGSPLERGFAAKFAHSRALTFPSVLGVVLCSHTNAVWAFGVPRPLPEGSAVPAAAKQRHVRSAIAGLNLHGHESKEA